VIFSVFYGFLLFLVGVLAYCAVYRTIHLRLLVACTIFYLGRCALYAGNALLGIFPPKFANDWGLFWVQSHLLGSFSAPTADSFAVQGILIAPVYGLLKDPIYAALAVNAAAYTVAGYAVGRFALRLAPPGKATLIFLAFNLFPAANYFVMFGLRDPVILAGTTMFFLGLGRYLAGQSRNSLNAEVLLGAIITLASRPELAVVFVPSIGLIAMLVAARKYRGSAAKRLRPALYVLALLVLVPAAYVAYEAAVSDVGFKEAGITTILEVYGEARYERQFSDKDQSGDESAAAAAGAHRDADGRNAGIALPVADRPGPKGARLPRLDTLHVPALDHVAGARRARGPLWPVRLRCRVARHGHDRQQLRQRVPHAHGPVPDPDHRRDLRRRPLRQAADMNLRRQFAVVTASKFAVAGLNVLFVYLCTRRLPSAEAARFFPQYSAVMLASAFCGIGAGVAAFSVVSPAMNRGAAFAREYSALLLLGLAGIAGAAAIYAIAVALGLLAPVNPVATGIFLVGASCTLLMADLNRSAGDIALSILLQGAGPALVMLAALELLDIRTAQALFAAAAAAFATSAAAMFATGGRHVVAVTGAEVAANLPVALRAAPLPAVSNMQVHAEIVLASSFLGPAALGVFVLANRLATLVRMPALIAFRVFAPSMDEKLAESLTLREGDRSIGLRLFWSGALLLAAGFAALTVATRLGIVVLPGGFHAIFAVCAAVKLCGLLWGSPESVLVAKGRFAPIYGSTLVTLAAVAVACFLVDAAARDNGLIIVALVSSWFVLQRLVMFWATR
jgi:hypothetical protein